jgi:glycosyltransferase involved in cell wall biosynthesis
MIVINLVPVKAGGGMQNALSFLSLLKGINNFHSDFIIFCTQGSLIEEFCLINALKFKSFGKGVLGRFLYESFQGWYQCEALNAKLIFSLFGGAPLFSPKIYKISGFAYSNIIHNEIDFWQAQPPIKKTFKIIVDKLRLYLALRSEELIVETDYLREKSRRTIFKGKVVHVVEMAPSLRVTRRLAELGREGADKRRRPAQYKILYLSGPHPNKRIHELAETFKYLNENNKKYILVTTLPSDAPYFKLVERRFKEQGILSCLENIGPVLPDSVAPLLCESDAIINVALLESFSNNWVEAWASGKPLICTDADWARASCKNAAIYIDPLKPKESSRIIIDSLDSASVINSLIRAGAGRLGELPSPKEKLDAYLSIINEAIKKRG